MIVAVTGASGFLGAHLVDALIGRGHQVRAIVRAGGRPPAAAAALPVVAPLEAGALARACDGCDVLVHAAGVTRARRPDQFRQVNVEGTRAAVEAANACGARLVYISSQAAAGTGTLERPRHEDDEPRPLTPYGRSKLAAEGEVRARARVPWTILRPCAVYGPGDRQFLPLFRLVSRGAAPLTTAPTTAFSLIEVGDLAHAVAAAAAARADGETLFLAHPLPLTAAEILAGFAAACGRSVRLRRVPSSVVRLLGWAGEAWWRVGGRPLLDRSRVCELVAEGFVCATERARDRLGFTAATPFQEGAARTARWYREHGWM